MGREQLFVIGGILGSLFLIVIIAVVYNQFQFGDPSKAINSGKFIHWHADVTSNVCGVEQQVPRAAQGGTIGRVPGIHTHDDGRVHIEGTFKNETEIALKRYLAVVGIPYSDKGIYNKTDGSVCDTSREATQSAEATASARLRGTVQGNGDTAPKEVPDILNYSMRDGDKIRLIYQ